MPGCWHIFVTAGIYCGEGVSLYETIDRIVPCIAGLYPDPFPDQPVLCRHGTESVVRENDSLSAALHDSVRHHGTAETDGQSRHDCLSCRQTVI